MPAQFTNHLTSDSLGSRLRNGQPRFLGLGGDEPDDAPGTDEALIVEWMTRLHELRGVPFNYLVPDIGMAPPDSVRFFHVDRSWVAALMDGAFSIGQAAAPCVTSTAAPAFRRAASARIGATRARMVDRAHADAIASDHLRTATPEPDGTDAPSSSSEPVMLSGFVLRSAVVTGWPGLEVIPYGADGGALPIVRLEHAAPATLLCLVAGPLARVDFREPAEGLHFGVDRVGDDSYRVPLRYAEGDPEHPIGTPIPDAYAAIELRGDPTKGVVRLADVAAGMANRVWPGAPPPGGFTAAHLALELVASAQLISFRFGAADGGDR